MDDHATSWTAFEGVRMIATGEPIRVAVKTREVVDRGASAPILIFDDETSEQVETDLRGTVEEIADRIGGASRPEAAPDASRGPGRPKLGVVPREVTLLPRHWEWLNSQPGGASVALRKLVEEARRANADKDRARRARDATYRFMSVLAGNLPGYEEAIRALFANDRERFEGFVREWPEDVKTHLAKLTARCLVAAG